ncbi:MAG: SH3 domain-containing protein [Chloroflexi bacterium]|nr:SH3 domain-containing protein [Chloroflexota bacterium]
MKHLTALGIFVFALAVALFPVASSSPALAARPPLVLAFYYDWFDENIWKPNQVADMPVTPYTSRDPQTVARQIQQARGAGIDAFVVSWWGAGNPTDSNFKIVLDQARAANFSAAVDFEITSPFYKSRTDVINSLKNLLATHVNHPAYLRVGGKPVIFFWRQQNYSVEVWQGIRDTVDPNRQSLWIAEGTNTAYLRVFDGHHLYSIGWAQNPAAELQKFAGRVRAFGGDKIWVATVMPGNDDRKTGRKGAYVRDRRNGDFYRETWRGALSTTPDWTIITSWNEWVEGTQIEPSVTYGDLYLNITREFATQFKAGVSVPTSPPRPSATKSPTIVARTPTPTVTPTLIPGGVRANVTDIVRVRAEPSTDAAILGRLRDGAAVVLLAASDDGKWWQIAYPDTKRRGWISAEFTKPNGDTGALLIVQPSATPTPIETLVIETPAVSNLIEDPLAEDESPVEPIGPPAPSQAEPSSTPTAPAFDLPWLKKILPFLP